MIHELGIPIEAPGVLDSNAMEKVWREQVSFQTQMLCEN